MLHSYSSEIRSWTTGAMTVGVEVMKSTNIITITMKIINKIANSIKNVTEGRSNFTLVGFSYLQFPTLVINPSK